MAVPPEITTSNLTGTYTLNRTLSDSTDKTLKMQNVGWLVRQAVAYSNVETTLRQYTTEAKDGKPQQQRLDQTQLSTGGQTNSEDRVMDWQVLPAKNKIWGDVRGKSRYTAVEAVEGDAWLKEGWDESCKAAAEGGHGVVESWVEGKEGWTAHQVWGFAVVEGVRRHVRRIVACREGWKTEKVRMVYEWKGPVEEGGK